ncbi:unnamed protein product [Medioppia subpectinata]|uniref:Uncharacterized protein n=1 Tax=Medioppia subpectinata TaxID=1979941 RepID=A0A7R9KHQ0_9ACAR|nr:unnamed protein product [Medioppia subpectinata]CAG2103841.1 unnamed protein product [Medioppia subpectinata]
MLFGVFAMQCRDDVTNGIPSAVDMESSSSGFRSQFIPEVTLLLLSFIPSLLPHRHHIHSTVILISQTNPIHFQWRQSFGDKIPERHECSGNSSIDSTFTEAMYFEIYIDVENVMLALTGN